MFLLLCLCAGPSAGAEVHCVGFFLKALPAKRDLSYRPNPEAFPPAVLQQKVDAQEIRRFQGPEGSLELMRKHPFKNEESAYARIANQFLTTQLGFGFNEAFGIKGVIQFFKNQDKKTLLKALRGEWSAKVTLYNLLKLVSAWINAAHPQETAIDLTRKADLLKILNPDDSKSLSALWMELDEAHNKFVDLNNTTFRENKSLTAQQNEQNRVLDRALDLQSFEDLIPLYSPQGLGAWLARHSTKELEDILFDWVDKLNVSPEKTQLYKQSITVIRANPILPSSKAAEAAVLQRVSMVRYFLTYFFQERFPGFLNKDELSISFYAELSKVQNHLRQFDAFTKRQEILLEEALTNIDGFNQRVHELEQQMQSSQDDAIQSGFSSAHPELIQSIASSLEKLRGLKMTDLTPELLESRFAELERIHFNFDKISQELSRFKKQSEIQIFADLGFQWELLVPQKIYALAGYDYSSVLFSKDVVDFFLKNPERGSYFLAALSKGYVSTHNASGLRRLGSIDPSMRDIKVLKHGGKVRIVGRLIDKTLHFFYIYDEERPYDDTEMRRVIQRFRPPD